MRAAHCLRDIKLYAYACFGAFETSKKAQNTANVAGRTCFRAATATERGVGHCVRVDDVAGANRIPAFAVDDRRAFDCMLLVQKLERVMK